MFRTRISSTDAMLKGIVTLICLAFCQISHAMVDENNNGLSDVWERAYGAESLISSEDEDGDGISNAEEAICGTDPFDDQSFLKINNLNYVNNGLVLRWQSTIGTQYRLESSPDMALSSWTEEANIPKGAGGIRSVIIDKLPANSAFFRLSVKESGTGAMIAQNDSPDTDWDGQSDASEFHAGTDAFDASSRFAIQSIEEGQGTSFDFESVRGKSYRLQSFNESNQTWESVGDPMIGTGETLTASLVAADHSLTLRMHAEDMDSDSDGVTDWEEWAVGLRSDRAKSAIGDNSDMNLITETLATPIEYELSAPRPTATVGIDQPGVVEIERVKGFGPINVQLVFDGNAQSGRDYLPLPASVRVPLGNSRTLLPVETTPNAVAGTQLGVAIAGAPPDGGTVEISFLTVSALNPRDFGALGDGITDDTDAIQATINALAASSNFNTIHFPSGTYVLKKTFPDGNTGSGGLRQLMINSPNFAGRDLAFTGDPGSVIHSEVGSARAHMLLFIATFRSLEFRGLKISQGSTPKAAVPYGNAPNGSDGVSIVRYGSNIVEAVNFDNCVFENCHGSVFFYGHGYDVRGNLRHFGMYNSQLLNPYGAATENSGIAYGGGIQVGLTPWVGTATYEGNLFEGGGEDMTDSSKSPGGRLKDGCHFGNPLHLEFFNNVVRRMGVEAVFQIGGSTYTGVTINSFTMPPVDGVSTATVHMDNIPSTFIVGDVINVRTTGGPTDGGSNRIMIVANFDPVNRALILKNSGNPINPAPGSLVPADAQVFMDSLDEPSTADIRNNYVDGDIPLGAHPDTNPAGIVVNARARIRNNTLKNFEIGILLYPEVQTIFHPGSRFSIVEKNSIETRNPLEHPLFYTYGIQSWANDDFISDNHVTTPNSFRFLGITARGIGTRIENNRVVSLAPADNGYGNDNRSVGISFGNQSDNTYIRDNTTYGFDVGTGPESAHQSIPHRVINHRSVNDVLGVDFRGLMPD